MKIYLLLLLLFFTSSTLFANFDPEDQDQQTSHKKSISIKSPLTDKDIEQLAHELKSNPNIKCIGYPSNLDHTIFKKIISELKTCSNLRELYFKRCEIQDEDVPDLLEVMKSNTKLKSICLQNNKITQVGAQQLITAAGESSSINFINLQGNNIKSIPSGVVARGGIAYEYKKRIEVIFNYPKFRVTTFLFE